MARTVFGVDLDRDFVRECVRKALDGAPVQPQLVRVTLYDSSLPMGRTGEVATPEVLVTVTPIGQPTEYSVASQAL